MENYSHKLQEFALASPYRENLLTSNSRSSFIEVSFLSGYYESSAEETLVTGFKFVSKKNDIKPICTRKKIENFIEDLRNDQILKHVANITLLLGLNSCLHYKSLEKLFS